MAARSARSWNFSKYFGLFQWEKINFWQNTYFCLKMIFRQCYFYFFPHFVSGVGGFWKVRKIPHFFLFFLKPSLTYKFWIDIFQNVARRQWKTVYGKECNDVQEGEAVQDNGEGGMPVFWDFQQTVSQLPKQECNVPKLQCIRVRCIFRWIFILPNGPEGRQCLNLIWL